MCLLGRADVDVGEEGDDRRDRSLIDHDGQTIVEGLDRQVFFERLDILSHRRSGDDEDRQGRQHRCGGERSSSHGHLAE
jgi:hypothetical protein